MSEVIEVKLDALRQTSETREGSDGSRRSMAPHSRAEEKPLEALGSRSCEMKRRQLVRKLAQDEMKSIGTARIYRQKWRRKM
jgi:hypothetical protein